MQNKIEAIKLIPFMMKFVYLGQIILHKKKNKKKKNNNNNNNNNHNHNNKEINQMTKWSLDNILNS